MIWKWDFRCIPKQYEKPETGGLQRLFLPFDPRLIGSAHHLSTYAEEFLYFVKSLVS